MSKKYEELQLFNSHKSRTTLHYCFPDIEVIILDYVFVFSSKLRTDVWTFLQIERLQPTQVVYQVESFDLRDSSAFQGESRQGSNLGDRSEVDATALVFRFPYVCIEGLQIFEFCQVSEFNDWRNKRSAPT
eukprot:sb/3475110/